MDNKELQYLMKTQCTEGIVVQVLRELKMLETKRQPWPKDPADGVYYMCDYIQKLLNSAIDHNQGFVNHRKEIRDESIKLAAICIRLIRELDKDTK